MPVRQWPRKAGAVAHAALAGALGAAAALRARARSRLGRPRRRLRAPPDPLGADAGLRACGPPAAGRLQGRAPRARPGRDPAGRDAARGRARDKLFRYPGLKEDYYLADFEPDRRPRRARDRRGSSARRHAAVSRDVRLPRDNPLEERGARSPCRRRGRTCVVIPRTEAQAERIRARAGGEPHRPRPGDRRPEPDRVRRPRGQRRRHDEPRGGRAGHARLHDLQRPDGRRRRAADRRRAAAPARAIPASSSCASATPRRARSTRAIRSCSSTRILGAVGDPAGRVRS